MSSPAIPLECGEAVAPASTDGWHRMAGLELIHKLRVLVAVEWTSRRLANQSIDLPQALDRARSLGPNAGVFAVEGIALHWADSHVESAPEATRFLLDPELRVSADERLMLHAGLGLSYARRLLAALPRRPSRSQLEDVAARFVTLCERSCDPMFLTPALEALGMVAQRFHAAKVALIAEVVAADTTLAHLFWHGTGRARYFDLVNLLPGPGSVRRVVRSLRRAAPDESCLASAEAGLAWAVGMVLLPHPALVARQLLAAAAAGANPTNLRQGLGVVQWVRRSSARGQQWVEALRSYRAADPGEERLWRRLVEVADGDPSLLTHPALGNGRALLERFAWAAQNVAPFGTEVAHPARQEPAV